VSTRRTVLVVAAWEPELERFRNLGREYLESISIEAGLDLQIAAAGIGLVDTTVGTTRCIFQHAPAHVVLLGTCGAAPSSGLAIGDVILGTRVRLVDPAVVGGRAAMPYANEAVTLDTKFLDAVSAGAREATIANTLGITTDDTLAAVLAPLGDVEHLEAYGVARACEVASLPCTVILGVANIVGARGRDQWRANHVALSARAADVAWAAIRALRTSTTPRSPV
jgi:nucleoside phosphorylase